MRLIILILLLGSVNAQDFGETISVTEYRDTTTFTDPFARIKAGGQKVVLAVDTTLQDAALSVEQDTSIVIGLRQYSNPYRTWQPSQGFRVQIYNGDRENASLAQFDFMELATNEEVYIAYEHPNFKVRCGNFITESEAKTFVKDLQKHFPGAYVVPSEIELQR